MRGPESVARETRGGPRRPACGYHRLHGGAPGDMGAHFRVRLKSKDRDPAKCPRVAGPRSRQAATPGAARGWPTHEMAARPKCAAAIHPVITRSSCSRPTGRSAAFCGSQETLWSGGSCHRRSKQAVIAPGYSRGRFCSLLGSSRVHHRRLLPGWAACWGYGRKLPGLSVRRPTQYRGPRQGHLVPGRAARVVAALSPCWWPVVGERRLPDRRDTASLRHRAQRPGTQGRTACGRWALTPRPPNHPDRPNIGTIRRCTCASRAPRSRVGIQNALSLIP